MLIDYYLIMINSKIELFFFFFFLFLFFLSSFVFFMSKLGKSSGFRRLFRRAPSQDIEKVISPGIAPSQSLEEIHALAQSYTGGPGSVSLSF